MSNKLVFTFDGGDWAGGSFVAHVRSDGWARTLPADGGGYTMADIPSEHLLALQAVITAIVDIGADWQATVVTASKATVSELVEPSDDEGMPEYTTHEVVDLLVLAGHPELGCREFTHVDYPQLRLDNQACVDFFDYFTTEKETIKTEEK